MRCEEVISQDDTNRTVASEIVNVPLIFEGQVSVVHSRDESMVVVGTEGRVVHEPDEVGSIRAESDIDSLGSVGSNKGDTAEGSGGAQRVISAVLELGGSPAGTGSWEAVGIGILIVYASGCLSGNTVGE